MWTLLGGEANGSLTLRFRGIQQAEDVLRFYLEIRDQLDELVNHVLEVTLNHQPLELKDMTEG